MAPRQGHDVTLRCQNLPAARVLCWLALAVCWLPLAARADSAQDEAQRVEGLWLNPGFYAYHFQRDRNLNNNAAGFGAEYRFSPASAVTAGVFHDSNWHTSHYVGYYWRPLALGRMRVGVVAGAADGYPGTRNGNWFPVAVPTASVEYRWLGLNLYYIPSYRNSVNGSLTFQLKLKVY